MGLGKTLTMISLIMKSKELSLDDMKSENSYRIDYKIPGGTLVVCPASLLSQWEGEVKRRVRRGLVDLLVYHGPKRETRAKR